MAGRNPRTRRHKQSKYNRYSKKKGFNETEGIASDGMIVYIQ